MRNFAILMLLLSVGLSFAITPANSWTYGVEGKYNWNGVVVNDTTEGGNVTNMNIYTNVSTEKWAGYWGNLTGRMILAPDLTNMFYTWTWTAADGGEVCAVAAQSGFDWSGVEAVANTDVDTVWGFNGGDVDSAVKTLTDTCGVTVAETTVVGSAGNTTGLGTDFTTCAVGDGDAYTAGLKENLAFCVEVDPAGNLFNGQVGNYELLVPTNEAGSTTEIYYFWMELT